MKRRGFTLIELLVVIAIIAILAAILFPVFVQATERGRQATCCSNLKQLSQAFFSYCDDNNGFLPISQRRQMIANGWLPRERVIEWTGSRWSDYGKAPAPCNVKEGSLYKGGYARNVGVFNCPSDRDVPSWYGTVEVSFGANGNWDDYFTTKPEGVPGGFGVTYSMNEDLSQKSCSGSPSLTTIKLAQAVAGRAGQVLLLIHERRGVKGSSTNQNDGYFNWRQGDPQGIIHWDGTTCSFADGHTKWLSNKQIAKIENILVNPNHSAWARNSSYYGYGSPNWHYAE